MKKKLEITFLGNDVDTLAIIGNHVYLINSVDHMNLDYEEWNDEIPEDMVALYLDPMEHVPASLMDHIHEMEEPDDVMTCAEYVEAHMANQVNKGEWAAGYPGGMSMEDLHYNDTVDVGLGTERNDIDPATLNNLPGNWNEMGKSMRITDLEENFDTGYDITPTTGEFYWCREEEGESWIILASETPEQAMKDAAMIIDGDIEIGAGRWPDITTVYFRADSGEWLES